MTPQGFTASRPWPRVQTPDVADPVAGRTFDLLVLGGGINGAAIARDASLRGLSVCLIEKEDWGWGTSAKSSKLAHGGLRYLELFEFGLVHEALQDRERFLRDAPHLVRPLRFLYPIYPHVAARRAVRAGLLLYDVLSHGKSVPGRHYFGRDQTLALAPGLNPEGLRGGATYFDGQVQSVERLVLEMVLEARAAGAVCLNGTPCLELVVPDGPDRRATGARVRLPDGRTTRVQARAVVNATGCWVDETLGALAAGKPAKVRKTKGIHVVVPKFTEVALLVKAAKDGRTFFILPWQDTCVIGTTDTDYQGDAGEAAATADDVAYLLDEAAHYFPDAPLGEIRYTYAGVRALVNEVGVTESNVTRRHILYDHARRDGIAGLWSLQGGKITTARTLAEECVDQVCGFLQRPDLARRHPTRKAPYLGCPDEPWDTWLPRAKAEAEQEGLEADSARHLVETYGRGWRDVLACDPDRVGRQPIAPGCVQVRAEVTFAIRHEDARTLADVLLRRTTLGLAADGNPLAARAVLAWMGDLSGWDTEHRDAQWQAYQRAVAVLAVPTVAVPVLRKP